MAKDRKAKRDPAGDFDQQAIIRAFKERGKPLSTRDVLKALGAPKLHKGKLQDMLEGLARQGRIIRLQGAWGLAESLRLVTGALDVRRSGVGYLLCDDKNRKDIFIDPRDMGDAWHGDHVAVAVVSQRGETAHGRVARVIKRASQTLPCRVERRIRQGLYLCRPTDPRLSHAMLLEQEEGSEPPTPGDVVTLEAGEKLDHQLYAGTLREYLGNEADVLVQEKLVKMNHQIPGPFPASCLEQASKLPPVPSEEDFHGRADLRHMDFVTIDGATARDFDDAILVERKGSGYTLWVGIADVSHYVQADSPLDLEAIERGNSYYFPRSVEPMFPEALSNGLCSLNPDVPRLSMVVETDFTHDGLPGESRFHQAVILSKARLTYDQVHEALTGGKAAPDSPLARVLPMLTVAEKLARQINARRLERGSLDFDLPEPEIHVGQGGETEDIRPRQRHFSHQIIEEFMIAANEAVARFLTERGAPLPYRIHPEPDPDKLMTLFGVLGRTGLATSLPPEPSVKGLQNLLKVAAGSDMEFLASRLLLRAMMQAKYHTQNLGHFGLASECYCHFTSPIRRYADLMVHRALKAALAGQGPPLPVRKMQTICDHISARERVAMEAEREILKRLTVLFLRDKVGQEFDGVVSSLSDFGFWVEMTDVMAEGLVRLSTLTDDYYALFPERQELLGQHTGRRITLGHRVRVELMDVNLGRLEVNLRLMDSQTAPGGRTPRPRVVKPAPRRSKAAPPSGRKARAPRGRKR